MATRGETIGRAYVRILADGAGLPQSIKDEMNDANPVVRAAGERHSEAYMAEWRNRMSQEHIGDALREHLEAGVARADVADAFFASNNWKKFVRDMRTRFGDAGVVAAHELSTRFAHDVTGMETAVDRIHDRIAELRVEIERAGRSEASATFFSNIRNFKNDLIPMEPRLRGFRRNIASMTAGFLRAKGPLESFADGFDRFGDRAAITFGKGSRNNLLNFFGSMVGNLVRLPGLLGNVGSTFLSFGARISGAFVNAGGGVVGFASAVAEMAPMLAAGAAGLFALIAILGILTSAISLLAGAIIALTSSIVFGLIGALAPLVGLLAPVAIAVGALATAFIGLSDAEKKVLKEAFTPMMDALKDLGDVIRQPILDSLVRNADEFTKAVSKWKPLFRDIGQVFGGFVDRFTNWVGGDSVNRFRRIMENTLPSALDRFGTAVGNFVDGLLNIFGVLNAKGGPVDTFLTWLVDITEEFQNWTATAAGRRDIRDFFDKAGESARALGDFLGGVWDIVKRLFFSDSGKQVGDSLFGQMGDALSEWAESITDEDLRQWFEDSKEFAENVGRLAEAFGRLAAALDSPGGRRFANLLLDLTTFSFDSIAAGIRNLSASLGEFRQANEEGEGSGGFLGFLNRLTFENLAEQIVEGFKNLGPAIQKMFRKIDWFKPLLEDAKKRWQDIKDFFGGIDWDNLIPDVKSWFDLRGVHAAIITPFTGLGKDIVDKVSFDLTDVIKGAGQVVHFVLSAFPFPSDIVQRMAFELIRVVQGIGSLFNTIVQAFPTAADIIRHVGQIVFDIDINWPDPPSWFTNLPGTGGGGFDLPLPSLPDHIPGTGIQLPGKSMLPGNLGSSVTEFGTGRFGKSVTVGSLTVVTPTEDPFAVANEVVNNLVGSAYF